MHVCMYAVGWRWFASTCWTRHMRAWERSQAPQKARTLPKLSAFALMRESRCSFAYIMHWCKRQGAHPCMQSSARFPTCLECCICKNIFCANRQADRQAAYSHMIVCVSTQVNAHVRTLHTYVHTYTLVYQHVWGCACLHVNAIWVITDLKDQHI